MSKVVTTLRPPKGAIAIVAAALLVGGIAASPASAAPAATSALPALPAPLNVPGAQNAITQMTAPGNQSSLLGGGTTGGGATMGPDGRTNINLPLVPAGGVRHQFANAPAVESSTKPACAPFMLIAVPGTFEINRDDNPNKPVGMLAKLADPLKNALGNRFSSTMINYDADAGVNGTSYARSVDNGVKKTLATITDATQRCANANLILAGYSQGADIAGDAATAIGNKRTAVNPNRIVAVALFSDPQRADNSNVIAGTNQARPNIPDFLQKAIGQLANDPSFAQLQMNLTTGVQSLLQQAGQAIPQTSSSDMAGASEGSTSTPAAGQDNTSTPSADPGSSTDPGSSAGDSGSSTGGATTPESADPNASPDGGAGASTTPSVGIAGASFLRRGGTVQLVDFQAASAGDKLAKVTGTEQYDSMKQLLGDPVTAISAAGEVVTVQAADIAKLGTGNYMWNRAGWIKDKRRKVIDQLYWLGAQECAGKSLQQCRDEYVDAIDGTHPGLLADSNALTATLASLSQKTPNANVPAQIPDSCKDKQAADCARLLAYTAPQQSATSGTTVSNNLGGLSTSAGFTNSTGETLQKAQFVIDDNNNTPIVQLGRNSEGKKIADNSGRTTSWESCKTAESGAWAAYGDSNQTWLRSAWNRAFQKSDNGKLYIDMSESELLGLTGTNSDCIAWSAMTAQSFLKAYLAHRIIYSDRNFHAPNDTPQSTSGRGSDSDRRTEISNLYSYGGCGEFDNNATQSIAPNGTWSLDTCRREYLGNTSKYGRMTLTQLRAIVADSQSAYTQNAPAWTRDVLSMKALGAGNNDQLFGNSAGLRTDAPVADVGCGPYAVSVCAAAKTAISGPAAQPAGLTTMVHPSYPPVTNGAFVSPGRTSETQTANSPADIQRLTTQGYVWADQPTAARVKALDAAVAALGASGDQPATAPDGVSTLIKKSDPPTQSRTDIDGDGGAAIGTTVKVSDLSAAQVKAHLANGWVWGRSDSQNDERKKLVYGMYTLGACGDHAELTWKQCYQSYFDDGGPVSPNRAVSNGELAQRITQLNSDQTRLHSGEQLGAKTQDLMKDCADQNVVQCGKKFGLTLSYPNQDGAGAPDPTGTEETTEAASPATTEASDEGDSGDSGSGGGSTGSGDTGSGGGSTNTGDTGTAGTDTENAGDSGSGSTAPTTTAAEAGGAATTSAATDAGNTAGATAGSSNADGGLADRLTNLITGTGGSTSSTDTTASTVSTSGGQVATSPITQRAVAGGGLAGPREQGFGALQGRVISFCVPGDLVCSLPANSELARDLTKFAQNVSMDFPDMLSDQGATKMGGLLALQGLNTVADITGMPRTKLTATTLQALINIAAGGAMLAAQNPAGTALVADGVSQLPNAMPEIFAQLRDIPTILRGLPNAGNAALQNTGLDKQLARINQAFASAGMTSPLQVDKYPAAASALMQGLAKDNTGLVQLVTNPQYWQSNAHLLYPQLKVAGDANTFTWVEQWVQQLVKLAGGGR